MELPAIIRGRTRLLFFSCMLFFAIAILWQPFTSSTQSAAFPKYTDEYTYTPDVHLHALNSTAKRVAIVGAGASGTSAAWFLNRAAHVVAGRLGVDPSEVLAEIVVIDKNGYVGGSGS